MSHSDNLEALILKLQEAKLLLVAGKLAAPHFDRDFKDLGPKRLGLAETATVEDYAAKCIREVEEYEIGRIEAVLGPKVGMGVTYTIGSDRYPGTVVEVISPKKIVVQQDNYKRTDSNGLSESQEYEYSPNPKAVRTTLTLRKNGRWVEQGQEMWGGGGYCLGIRRAYSDPSF